MIGFFNFTIGQTPSAATGTNWTIQLIEWVRTSSLSKSAAKLLGYEEAPKPPDWVVAAIGAGIAVGIVIGFISVVAMFSIWLERRIAGRIQARIGPNRVGPFGLLQSLADGVKLLLKEDIIPTGADRGLFILAPALVMSAALGMFAALPMAAGAGFTDLNLGIVFIIAISSLATIGVIMAGWSSNNKWALYGAIREAAQVVSYEIPLGLSLLVPAVVAGSMNLREITEAQGGWSGMCWLIFQNPFCLPAFVLYFVAALAETKRAPFDLPESESELVAGFHTEYSGIRFSFFFLEEYGAMFIMSALGVLLFLGGWNFPGMDALSSGWLTAAQLFVFILKSFVLIFVMIWVRWTLPRLRVDQVMVLSYKYLTPIGLAFVLGSAGWEVLVAGGRSFADRAIWLQIFTPVVMFLIIAWLGWLLRRQRISSESAPFDTRRVAPRVG